MAGVNITIVQSSGVTTTFATILDLRWQPNLSADVMIGYFIDEPSYTSGMAPVYSQYVGLDITQINTTGNIPAQILAQLTAAGAVLAGGTPTS
jgi:hypothetical protein